MVRFTLRSLILLLVVGSLTMGLASSDAIGLATAKGSFLVDHATVAGNSSLFDGTLVETGEVPSTLSLTGGIRMQLGSASRGKVHRRHMVLEQGVGQVENASGFLIEARSLHIEPDNDAYVALSGANRVLVSASSAPVRVTTTEGVLLANLAPGTSLELEPQAAGAAAPFTVTGCLVNKDGRFLLTDRLADVTLEARGPNLTDHAGFQVELTGTNLKGVQPLAGASEVIHAVRVRRLHGSCATVPPATRGNSGRSGKSNGGVAMSGVTKTMIAGVVVAGAGAGAAVGVSAGEQQKKSISR